MRERGGEVARERTVGATVRDRTASDRDHERRAVGGVDIGAGGSGEIARESGAGTRVGAALAGEEREDRVLARRPRHLARRRCRRGQAVEAAPPGRRADAVALGDDALGRSGAVVAVDNPRVRAREHLGSLGAARGAAGAVGAHRRRVAGHAGRLRHVVPDDDAARAGGGDPDRLGAQGVGRVAGEGLRDGVRVARQVQHLVGRDAGDVAIGAGPERRVAGRGDGREVGPGAGHGADGLAGERAERRDGAVGEGLGEPVEVDRVERDEDRARTRRGDGGGSRGGAAGEGERGGEGGEGEEAHRQRDRTAARSSIRAPGRHRLLNGDAEATGDSAEARRPVEAGRRPAPTSPRHRTSPNAPRDCPDGRAPPPRPAATTNHQQPTPSPILSPRHATPRPAYVRPVCPLRPRCAVPFCPRSRPCS